MKESYEDAVRRIVENQNVSWEEAEEIYANAQADAAEQAYDESIGN